MKLRRDKSPELDAILRAFCDAVNARTGDDDDSYQPELFYQDSSEVHTCARIVGQSCVHMIVMVTFNDEGGPTYLNAILDEPREGLPIKIRSLVVDFEGPFIAVPLKENNMFRPGQPDSFNLIDARFDQIQRSLLDTFGDEANDIGDAANAYELLGNLMLEHDSYTPDEALTHVAGMIGVTLDQLKGDMSKLADTDPA